MNWMSSANSLISVVVPTYNRAHLIVNALDSIAAQDYRPIEIIVVDDGSTDDTPEIVKAWCECYGQGNDFGFHYIQQENQGGNVARNSGIAVAKGVYIAFLDSDDLWHSQKLSKQLERFRADPQVGGVYCGVRHIRIGDDRTLEPTSRHYPQGQLLEQMLIHDVTAPTSTYVVHKEVFEKVGCFDIELQARQDWDMWIRLATEYKIAAVPEPLVDFREHVGPRTDSNPQKEITAYARIMEKYAYLRKHCSFSSRQEATAAFYRRMGRVHFHHKQLSSIKALVFYLRAIIAWPFIFDNYAALAGMLFPNKLRGMIHRGWNRVLGNTKFAIRSH
ncbi:hypothetical protein MNBD_GAMMA26-1258 [hydrothermal vent metagenome]|uniref:Glycosyltransferase 2-like domain-containing protein n=1 Tax=hydrothermal vent metagenome TaxID=652676 RepID=A0A3B1BMJ7_9ZZZZ